MNAVLKPSPLTVEEYLAAEDLSPVRHEYVMGQVFAMAGASDAHNTITINLVTRIHPIVRGKNCRLFATDMRLRVQDGDRYYYPDLIVTCDPRDTATHQMEFPKFLVEVLSESTEGTDRREKWLAYKQIETLEEYVIVSQERLEVTIFHRSNGWQPEIVTQLEDEVHLASIGLKVKLAEIYEGLKIGR